VETPYRSAKDNSQTLSIVSCQNPVTPKCHENSNTTFSNAILTDRETDTSREKTRHPLAPVISTFKKKGSIAQLLIRLMTY